MISDSPGRQTAGAIVSSCDLSEKQGDPRMLRDQLIPRLLSVAQAANALGFGQTQVRRLINEGKLPAAYAGSTIVLAESTVLRYAAGERFPVPSQLRTSVYDEQADQWVTVKTIPVKPEYEVPAEFDPAELGVADGDQYRVELLDTTGKTMQMVRQ